MEINVQQRLGHRVVLDLLDDRQAVGLPFDFEIDQHVFAHGMGEERVEIARLNLKGDGRFVVGVDHSRDRALAFNFFNRGTTHFGADLGGELHLFGHNLLFCFEFK